MEEATSMRNGRGRAIAAFSISRDPPLHYVNITLRCITNPHSVWNCSTPQQTISCLVKISVIMLLRETSVRKERVYLTRNSENSLMIHES
jgi:hypothetical protein